jgi:putative transposase
MTQMYKMLNLSRQNVSQKLRRTVARNLAEEIVLELAGEIRKDHPQMGCRKMYWKSFSQMPLGRDYCEQIMISNGLQVHFPPNFKRTTYSIGKLYYPNLIEGLTLNGLNQVWQTDITYYEVKDNFYYLVFIEDIYSRRIIGWSVDHSLWAQANLGALQKAIDLRNCSLEGLIHHSDRGGQYIDKDYINTLKAHQIKPSMCKHAWQNAYCERVNGIIKNEYLKSWKIGSFEELKVAVRKAVTLYNTGRPHWELPGRLTPSEFESKLKAFRIKPTMKLYSSQQDT